MVLHQFGWWACPSHFHLGVILTLSLLEATAMWIGLIFFRFATAAMRFLTLPCRLLIAICTAMSSSSLVEMQLAYSATFLVKVLFYIVRFVTED